MDDIQNDIYNDIYNNIYNELIAGTYIHTQQNIINFIWFIGQYLKNDNLEDDLIEKIINILYIGKKNNIIDNDCFMDQIDKIINIYSTKKNTLIEFSDHTINMLIIYIPKTIANNSNKFKNISLNGFIWYNIFEIEEEYLLKLGKIVNDFTIDNLIATMFKKYNESKRTYIFQHTPYADICNLQKIIKIRFYN